MRIAGIEMRELTNSVAAKLARAGDEEQAEFLNIFFRELASACETEYNIGMQLAFVREKLDDNAKRYADFLRTFCGRMYERSE